MVTKLTSARPLPPITTALRSPRLTTAAGKESRRGGGVRPHDFVQPQATFSVTPAEIRLFSAQSPTQNPLVIPRVRGPGSLLFRKPETLPHNPTPLAGRRRDTPMVEGSRFRSPLSPLPRNPNPFSIPRLTYPAPTRLSTPVTVGVQQPKDTTNALQRTLESINQTLRELQGGSQETSEPSQFSWSAVFPPSEDAVNG